MIRSTLDQLTSAARSSRARQVLEIAIDDVEPDPEQPRKTFQGLEELRASIVAIGIKQPLLVRPHPTQSGRYMLIAGERRHRAARLAGLLKVPCLLDTDDAEDPGRRMITQLTENLQREDAPILETARAIECALKTSGLSKGELARALGKKPSFVSKHLALLKAEGPAQEGLREGLLLSTETFRLFSGLPEPRQQSLLRGARLSGQPIARSLVERSPQGAGKAQRQERARSPEPRAKRKAPERKLTLSLSVGQARAILERFGVDPPQELAQLKAALVELVENRLLVAERK